MTGARSTSSASADAAGYVYAAGEIGFAPVDFGVRTLDPADGFSYLVRYTPSGEPEWAVNVALDTTIGGLSTDADGRTLLAGGLAEGSTNAAVESAGGLDLLALDFAADGGQAWVWSDGGPGQDLPYAAASAGEHRVLGGEQAPSAESTAFLADIASLDADGAVEWQHTYGDGAQWQDLRAVAVEPSGAVVAGGAFEDTLTLGDEQLSGGGSFVVRFDETGTVQWAKRIATSVQAVQAVAVDGAGAAYVLTPGASTEDGNPVITRYEADGTIGWSWESPYALAGVLAVDGGGTPWFAAYGRTFDQADGTATSSDYGGAYVASLTPEGVERPGRFLPASADATGASSVNVMSLSTGAEGQIVLAGSLIGSLEVGSTLLESPLPGQVSPFVASLLLP